MHYWQQMIYNMTMKIHYTTIYTLDKQDEALEFYTKVLGFIKKTDMMVGAYRWLTLVSPDDPDGAELILDANDTPALRALQESYREYNMPSPATFIVTDLYAECKRLEGLGITLVETPTRFGEYQYASFADPCGNLVQVMQTDVT